MIEWIVSSSALILLVLAVRAAAKTRLSCRARYALWLLVLARLLVPAQLFTASWGVAEAALPKRVTEPSVMVMPLERQELPTQEFYNSDTALPIMEGYGPNGSVTVEFHGEQMQITRYAAKWSVADIFRAVWLAGVGAMAVVLLASNLRFARRLRRTRTPYDALVGGMRVYIAEGIASPCLVGVFRPTVYLTPECARDERTLRHVLAHETTHRLHGDCVWSLLRLTALCLHWYNPLAWYAAVVSKRDGELACDEATLARLGEDERVAYGETLLSMVTAKPRGRDLLSVTTSMTAGKKPMRERIETIAKHPRTKAVALILALAVLLSATVFAFSKAEPPEAAEKKPQEQPEAEQRVEASVPDAAETLLIDNSYEGPVRRYNGEGWYVWVPEDWDTHWTSGFDPEEVADHILFRATGSGDWQGEGLSVFTIRHSAEEELRDLEQRGYTVDWPSYAAESGTVHTRVYDAPNRWCYVVSWQDPTGRYEDTLRSMAASFTMDSATNELGFIETTPDPAANEAAFFESIAGEYWFLSGAGGWRTELTIAANGDGTFTGEYSHGSERSAFSGRFGDVTRVNDTWSMRLTELDASAYGIEGADEVLVYLPGTPVDALPEEFLQWYCAGLPYGRNQIGNTLPTVGLYNVNEQYGWFARSLIGDGWEPLTADELAAWADRLGSTDERWSQEDGYYVTYPSLVSCFFTSYYSTPRDINLDEFLTYCPLGMDINLPDGTMTEKEREALIATGKYYGYDVPTWRYRVSDINAALTQYAGITLDDMTTDWRNDERMLYLPEYDAFYNFTSDFGPGTFVPESGMHLGSIVRLDSQWSTLQLSGTPDNFQIMSFTER